MKSFVLSIFTSLFIFNFSASAQQQQQQISWLNDFKEAGKIAVESGKPMLLDFTASWCKPCREMEKIFWTRADVIELAKNFVCVKVDLDQNARLADKYGVSAIPNVVSTDSWGYGLAFHRGFGLKADAEIMEKLRAVPKDFSQIKEANDTIAADKNNLAALSKIADFYQQKKIYYLSSEFYKRLLKQEKNPAEREKLLLTLGFNYLKIGWSKDAKDLFEKFQKEFPASAQADAALYGKFYACAQQNSLDDAEKILAELKAKYPKSKFVSLAEQNLEKVKSSSK